MNISHLFRLADSASAAAPAGMDYGISSTLYMLVSFAVIALIFYFGMVKPQKKKEQEQKNMRESLQIGDEVTTIGGITGFVLRKQQDTVVIETGANRNQIRVKIWAISENLTKHDAVEEGVKKKKSPIETSGTDEK